MWLAPHFMAPRRRRRLGPAVPEDEGHLDLPAQSDPVHGRGAPARAAALRQRRDLLARRRGQGAVRAIRKGDGFFNLPDMDFGTRDAAFVPFFGVPAVTLLAPSRSAKALDMIVQPVVAEILPGGEGYLVRFEEPWTDFPSDDPVADAARMNRWIESEIRRNPAQYLWVHRRFKTRPPGEPSLY
jgi:KDO2-lipid IV(A) lauroyltransferase